MTRNEILVCIYSDLQIARLGLNSVINNPHVSENTRTECARILAEIMRVEYSENLLNE